MGAEGVYAEKAHTGEAAVTRRPLTAPLQPIATRTGGEITLPASYTDGPYRKRLITAIRSVSDFSRASDPVVAFEALRRLGYGEELSIQLNTKLSATREIGQPCDLATLAAETERVKQEILNQFYPNWRELVQPN